MEKPIGVKIKDIELSNIRIMMEYNEAIGTDIFDDDNENEHVDHIHGEILYFDPELFDEENIDDEVIGTFKLRMLYGPMEKIYNTFICASITDVRYEEEIFDIEYMDDGRIRYDVRDEYWELLPEVYENSFMILDRIEIKEMYRGKGILKRTIDTIKRTYRQPILTKPFPLQHEGDEDITTFKSDMRKVVNAYKKCGFVRGRKRSKFLIQW